MMGRRGSRSSRGRVRPSEFFRQQFHVHMCRCRPYLRAWLPVVVVDVVVAGVVATPARIVVFVAFVTVVVVVVVVFLLFRRWDFPPAPRQRLPVVIISSTLFLM